jgi:DNA-binding SARP family transcriptional activator/tetratricopeptide (TPR) repeat protein/TolB-like protein
MLQLRTLGQLDLRDSHDGRTIGSVLAQPKRLALLVYLVLARPRGCHPRNELLGTFWPDVREERGRHALRQALYQLRQSLGEDVLTVHGASDVGIDPAGLWCDAREFDDLLDRGDTVAGLELYGGHLLVGFAIDDCPDFDDWLERRRGELRQRAVDAALATEGADELRWLRAAAGWAPWDETVLRRLMQALVASGQPGDALQAYATTVARLRDDLEFEPSPETVRLAAAIRSAPPPPAMLSLDGHTPAAPARPPGVAARTVAAARTIAADRPPVSRPRHIIRVAGVAAAAGFALLLGTRAPSPDPAAPLATSATRVLVASFERPSGDATAAVVAEMAADWIAQGLTHTGMVQVVPGSMLRREGERMRESVAALAAATGSGYIVHGSVYRHDSELVFQVRIARETGELLRGVEYRAPPDEPVVVAVDRLRQRVLGAFATVLDARLAAWADAASQPPSFEAYRLVADGMDLFYRQPTPDYRGAATRFQAAALSDTAFTAPLIWAAFALYQAAQMTEADSLARSLASRRDRIMPWDRAMLDWLIAAFGPDRIATYDAMHRVVAIVPASEWRFQLAVEALSINRPREALDILIDIDPTQGWLRAFPRYWRNRANARHHLGDFEGELREVALMRRQFPGSGDDIELRALAALGRADSLAARLAALEPDMPPPRRASTRHMIADELRAHGHADAAATMLTRALELYDAAAREAAGQQGLRIPHASALFSAGRDEEARPLLKAVVAERPYAFGAQALLGSIAARAGRVDEAERIASELERHRNPFNYGEDTLRRACIPAHLGDRQGALRVVREAFSHGLFFSPFIHTLECLFELHGDPQFEALMRPRG